MIFELEILNVCTYLEARKRYETPAGGQHRRLNVNVMLGHLRTLQIISTSLAEYASDMHPEI